MNPEELEGEKAQRKQTLPEAQCSYEGLSDCSSVASGFYLTGSAAQSFGQLVNQQTHTDHLLRGCDRHCVGRTYQNAQQSSAPEMLTFDWSRHSNH